MTAPRIALRDALTAVMACLEAINEADSGFTHDRDGYALWSRRRREAQEKARQQLEALGARVRDDGSRTTVRLAGLSASSTMGLASALRNWRAGATRKFQCAVRERHRH